MVGYIQGPVREPPKLSGVIRASGYAFCEDCGKLYFQHPMDYWDLSYDGTPFLNVLCDGTRVKL